MRTSKSSVDLRISCDDILLPVARSNLRQSLSNICLSDDIYELSQNDKEEKENLQNKINEEYPEYNYTASLINPENDIKHLIQYFFPDDNILNIKIKQLTGGITNSLYLIKDLESIDKILIRISGENTDVIIDRDLELSTLICLSSINVAPKLYGRFKNGLIYGFIEGKALKTKDLKDNKISQLIAEHLGYFHAKAKVIGIPNIPILFDTILKWLETAETTNSNDINQVLNDIKFSFNKCNQRILDIQQEFDKKDLTICYCHNDLLSGNIIYDIDTNNIHFIDFEYGGYNYCGFDIGNHFCEMMGFELDENEYPSKDFQYEWLTCYLKSFYCNSNVTIPQDFTKQIDKLYKLTNKMALLAHLFWGIWAIIQHQYSKNKNFDYLSYAKERLSCYLKMEFKLSSIK